MSVASDVRKAVALVRRAVTSRRAAAQLRHRLLAGADVSAESFPIGVYFADGAVNMYQIRSWYRPLEELAKTWPVLVLARAATGARALLDDGALPVVWVPTVASLEQAVAEHELKIVLYVNQNTRNFQMFRYGRRWHVFINHGESDKMYMTTNQFKAYDYAFVAGNAARERLGRVLWDWDIDRRAIEIGRPQADHYAGTLPYTPDDRTVVLYAPTWEGDRPAAHYGSILSHGEALIEALVASGRHRVVYRPHPRSGVVDHAYGVANERIKKVLREASAADPGAHHVVDESPELGWQLAAADIAIVDISAMVYDRLAADRPLLVTRPVDPEAEIDENGYLSACDWLLAADAPVVAEVADRVLADPDAVARLDRWVRHYFGDTAPGAATARFHGAVARLLAEWDVWHARSAGS